MGLIDDLKNENNFKDRPRAKCKMCEILKELPPTESKALEQRLANPKIGHTAISKVLFRHGIEISRSAIYRHREVTYEVFRNQEETNVVK